MASSNRTSASSATRSARSQREEPRAWPVSAPSRAELAAAFAMALDLAEGREPGHAARVCYIALSLAEAIDLPADQRRVVYYGALLHDAGAAPASAEFCRLADLSEEAIFGASPGTSPQQLALEIAPSQAASVVELLRDHPERGAQVARDLGLDEAVQRAVVEHHERWDGHGYPRALKGDAIQSASRVIAAADLIEASIAAEPNVLAARRSLADALAEHAGRALDPTLAERACGLLSSDGFWLGLHHEALPQELAGACPQDPVEAERSPADLWVFASVFADLADTKGEHMTRHSERTAELADEIAGRMGFEEGRREMLRIAAVVHDVGLLGVPARVIAKPDILSLAEMEAMRKHPTYSQMILEALPGLEQVALWAGAHHERPDGKGYPEMLEEGTIPLEARIIAVANTYVALTSSRPYRRALSDEDAQQVLLGGAGAQLDRKLVKLFCSNSLKATSSRTARRSRQTR